MNPGSSLGKCTSLQERNSYDLKTYIHKEPPKERNILVKHLEVFTEESHNIHKISFEIWSKKHINYPLIFRIKPSAETMK